MYLEKQRARSQMRRDELKRELQKRVNEVARAKTLTKMSFNAAGKKGYYCY